jgi:hypothetical protein
MTAPAKTTPKIRHEEFCQPTGGRTEVRIESYLFYEDSPKGGRSVATHRITRCMECGEQTIQKIGE